MKHILIIGGTGMLHGATTHFIDRGDIVTVLARNTNRLKALKERYPIKKGRVKTISQDYQHPHKALQKVKEAAGMFVRIDMAILWIHDTGSQFSEKVKEFLLTHHPKTKVYQLWGSAARNPLELSKKKWLEAYPDRYREIFLGYKQTGSSSRWLTNREIAEGTIKAVKKDEPQYSIGIIDPWESNPGFEISLTHDEIK